MLNLFILDMGCLMAVGYANTVWCLFIFLFIYNSDPNWWKGETYQGVGLFPSNFVTADLTAEPEMSEYCDYFC